MGLDIRVHTGEKCGLCETRRSRGVVEAKEFERRRRPDSDRGRKHRSRKRCLHGMRREAVEQTVQAETPQVKR